MRVNACPNERSVPINVWQEEATWFPLHLPASLPMQSIIRQTPKGLLCILYLLQLCKNSITNEASYFTIISTAHFPSLHHLFSFASVRQKTVKNNGFSESFLKHGPWESCAVLQIQRRKRHKGSFSVGSACQTLNQIKTFPELHCSSREQT